MQLFGVQGTANDLAKLTIPKLSPKLSFVSKLHASEKSALVSDFCRDSTLEMSFVNFSIQLKYIHRYTWSLVRATTQLVTFWLVIAEWDILHFLTVQGSSKRRNCTVSRLLSIAGRVGNSKIKKHTDANTRLTTSISRYHGISRKYFIRGVGYITLNVWSHRLLCDRTAAWWLSSDIHRWEAKSIVTSVNV